MNYALIIFFAPKSSNLADERPATRWQSFLASIENNKPTSPDAERVLPYLYVIPVESDLVFLAQCIAEATREQIGYRILFLEEKPAWIQSPKVNNALQRTAPCVTATASITAFPPAMQFQVLSLERCQNGAVGVRYFTPQYAVCSTEQRGLLFC